MGEIYLTVIVGISFMYVLKQFYPSYKELENI